MKKIFLTVVAFATVLSASANYGVILQTFESGITEPKGEFFVDNPDFASITLVDNPKKDFLNSSNKVAAVQVYTENPNSGIIKINFVDGVAPKVNYPENPYGTGDEVLAYYNVLRFKYYKGTKTSRNVEFEPNGSVTSPKTIIPTFGEDGWEYITIPLEWKLYQNFQIRVNRNEAGNGSATGTAEGDIIYVDDFELFNREDGPAEIEASTKFVLVDDLFSCKSTGNRSFVLNASLEKSANVKVDVISITGQTRTIYNQTVAGHLELPFDVNTKGVFCVRMTIDGKLSKIEKIIAR